MEMNLAKRILLLRQMIEEYDKKYYFDDDPEIEDYEYDLLKRELEDLERNNPEMRSSDSPLNMVGSPPSRKFEPVPHNIKMESLHDSFSTDEIERFYDKINMQFPSNKFTVEEKIDGLSLSVEYVDGHIFRASTRGDGTTGEDVTENALTIKNLPHNIKTTAKFLEIRGECFIDKETFCSLNKSQELEGKNPFKNSRNAAAGSIRQKDKNICKERNLQILFFNVQQVSDYSFQTHSESLLFLKELKLPVVNFKVCSNLDEILKEIDSINKRRNEIPYQIDGAVVKLDDLNGRKILGSTSNYPRWAEAFKYPPEVKKTRCRKIEVTVGRTGILTPVCIFDSVDIGGSHISKASLHNEEFVQKKDVRENDFVYIIKAGDIIPEVSKVEVDQQSLRHEKFTMPYKCPSCGERVSIGGTSEGKNYKCTNPCCYAILKGKILHFVSKNAMDIDGFGEETFECLKNELESITDIYKLDENILGKYDLFRNKKISSEQNFFQGFDESVRVNKFGKNLLKSINKSKKNSLERLLYGLGIPHVGKEIAHLISSHFKNLDVISKCSAEEFQLIDGVGSNTSNSIVNFFYKNNDIIKKIKSFGINIEYFSKKKIKFDTICCITGKFDSCTREGLTKKLEKKNIRVSSSLSSRTSFLICGKNPGSKLSKAKSLKIKILYEDDLNNLII